MSRFLIVGHPHSGYREVVAQLEEWGMQPAKGSKRDGMTPEQITRTLCDIHGAPPLSGVRSEHDVVQINPSPLWHGMALDLMLANVGQKFWGWSDPAAIFLLDYWRGLDATMAFVLVYDRHHSVVSSCAGHDSSSRLTPNALQQITGNWEAYNAALLHFFHRNKQRCLLVSSQGVRNNPGLFLKHLRVRAEVPASVATERLFKFGLGTARYGVNDGICTTGTDTSADQGERRLTAYLMSELLRGDHARFQVYEELQSVADLPHVDDSLGACTAIEAWNGMLALGQRLREQGARNEALQREVSDLIRNLAESEARNSRTAENLAERESTIRTLKGQVERLSSEPASAASAAELAEENGLLLSQLHQVQEELERYYLENERLKSAQPKANADASNVVPIAAYYGAAERVKHELAYRLGATMVSRSRSFAGWLGMPVALLRVRRQYRREMRNKEPNNLPPLEQYRDVHEAERVKRHLSFRLGKALIANSRTPIGWVRFPFALRHEIRDFRHDRKAA